MHLKKQFVITWAKINMTEKCKIQVVSKITDSGKKYLNLAPSASFSCSSTPGTPRLSIPYLANHCTFGPYEQMHFSKYSPELLANNQDVISSTVGHVSDRKHKLAQIIQYHKEASQHGSINVEKSPVF